MTFSLQHIWLLAEEVAAKITCMNISFLVYSNMQKALKLLKTEL